MPQKSPSYLRWRQNMSLWRPTTERARASGNERERRQREGRSTPLATSFYVLDVPARSRSFSLVANSGGTLPSESERKRASTPATGRQVNTAGNVFLRSRRSRSLTLVLARC